MTLPTCMTVVGSSRYSSEASRELNRSETSTSLQTGPSLRWRRQSRSTTLQNTLRDTPVTPTTEAEGSASPHHGCGRRRRRRDAGRVLQQWGLGHSGDLVAADHERVVHLADALDHLGV